MEVISVEKLDEGFIISKHGIFGRGQTKIALGRDSEEEILREVAFFLTGELDIKVTLKRKI